MTKKKLEKKPLLWEPVLRGATYCAPACGHGCTKAALDMAVYDADEADCIYEGMLAELNRLGLK